MEKRWSDLKTIPSYPVATGDSGSDLTDMDTYIQDLQRRLNQIVLSLSDEAAPVNLLQRVIPKLEARIKEARQRLSDLRAGNALPDSSSGFQPRRITEEQAARNFTKLLQGAPIIIELKDGTSIGSFDLTAAPPSSDSFSLEFECPVCEETANSKFELRTHITKRHLVNVKALKRLKAQNLMGAQWEPFASQQIPMENILVQSLSEELETGITKEMLEVFNARVLRPETLRSWLGEVARIQESLSLSVPGAEIRPYGSSCNGFATISSDIDLTLDVDVFSVAFKSSDLKAKIEDLFGVDETLDLGYKLIFDKLVVVLRHLSYVNIEERFEARIPIVKCINHDLGMEMDISLANLVAVENSRLLATYSEIDERAKQLGIAIKTWAKARRIGNPANHTLSSYSYLILLIAFLQRDLLLPNLQAEYDQEERVMKGDFDCSFESDPELFHELAQQNRKSTGRLLFEFFKHYSVFDWRSNCVSIRLPKNLTKSEKQWTKTLIAIEDPFELKRNLGDLPTISATRVQEPVTNPPDMNSPVVRKGFPFWEKVGASCIWLTKCFVRGERYITSGYTSDMIRDQSAQILANTFEPIAQNLRMKAVHLKIHDTNGLQLDPNVIHPIVKVHIIDINTGCYLRKESLRPAISTYENIGQINANKEVATGLAEFLLPFSTPPFDMRIAGECDPHWNQEFLINQDAAYLLKPDVVFLFEILDFHFKLIKSASTLLRKDRMYPIAWGFLRPSGFTKMNLGFTKVQLYRYKFKTPPDLNESRRPEVFYDFNWYRKELYPSFLRVELKPVEPPAPVEMPGRSLNPMEREIGIKRFEDFAKEVSQPNPKLKLAGKEEIDAQSLARAKKLTSWRRLYGESCRVPTKITYKFESSHLGCFRIAFSNNGKYLAAACTSEDTVIKIFQVEDGELSLTLRGHADLVHDLCWAESDMTLLSSSSDGTVKVWDFTALFQGGMDAAGFTSTVINPGAADFLVGNLNHPSYVYCARFHPDDKMEDRDIIATACFDGKVRIWLVTYPLDHVVERATTELAQSAVLSTIDIIPESRYDYQEIMGTLYSAKTEAERLLEMQKLTEDQGNERRHPNYLTFDNSGQLFIADSVGMVHIWSVQLRGDRVSTTLIRQIENDELSGDAINTLILTPPERRELMVQSRDNVIRIVEPGRGNKATSQGLIVRRFFGASVQKYSLRACVSPDGQYLASGSEDGKVYIWDVASGFKTDVSAWGVSCQHLVADVCWNPCYHMVAVALFGSEYPVLVFTYQKTRDEVEQNLLELHEPKKGEILAPHKDQRGAIAKEMGTRALPKRELF